MFGRLFGTKSTAPDASSAGAPIVGASVSAPIITPAGVILRVTNTDPSASATIDIQFTLDKYNKLTKINNGNFQIATSDGKKPITDSDFARIEIKNGILSIEAPAVTVLGLPQSNSNIVSSSSSPISQPPPGFKGGSKRRRAYRPRKGTRRNRITR